MSFHINSNLTPLEAVSKHVELQVHPIIEVWAEKAQKIEIVEVHIKAILSDEKLITATQVKGKLLEIIQTFGLS